jgi:hypothetical protein
MYILLSIERAAPTPSANYLFFSEEFSILLTIQSLVVNIGFTCLKKQ